MKHLTRRLLAGAAALFVAAAAWAQPQRGTVDVIPPWAIPGKATEPPASPTAPTATAAQAPKPGAPANEARTAPDTTPRTAPDPAAGPVAVPRIARVTDQANLLSAAERQALDAKLAAFEQARGSQVVVITVPSLGFETIEEFAGRVTDQWKLGRKGVDDGVLFVVASQDRKLRIHTGRGVQGTLTDALSKRIVSDIVSPRFRKGDYAGGIDAGVDAIFKAIEGENLALPAPKGSPEAGGGMGALGSIPTLLIIAFFVVPIVGGIMRSMFGRFFGATATAGLAGVAGTVLLGSLLIGIIAAVVAFLFTLIGGVGVGRAVGRGGRGPVFIPGGFGGGGGGWGGGGGFSGGGGGFDGGGASGSW